MQDWSELNAKQKILVEKLPGNADFMPEERKMHRFCTRCWLEDLPRSQLQRENYEKKHRSHTGGAF